jgi:hypothetical protein
MFRISFLFLILFAAYSVKAQPKTDGFLETILKDAHQPMLDRVLRYPEQFRCQIIYTAINRDKKNRPHFRNYYFNYDPQLYFNPASMVKLPLAALALEKLKELGINMHTTIQFDSSYPGQKALYKDSTAMNGLPSIAHFIRRAFLISENDPYNRFYQFVGQQDINRRLHAKGYPDVRITRQFMGFSQEQNRHTNGLRFLKEDGTELFRQPPAYNTDSFDLHHVVKLGRAYMNRNDSLIEEPFDFTAHNNLSLEDLQQVLQSILFPASVPPKQRFKLTDDDYSFLRRYLSQFPSETPYPYYDSSLFYDSYVKFFFRDSTRHLPPGLRVFNKVGWAYGFLTDVSYIVDFSNQVEFMLAATIYVNSDGVLNDNKYDYDTIGYPFLYQLGQAVYRYELERKRKHKSDLTLFKIPYEHRDPNDKRKPISEVDN